ncbi:MAG TPA: hypothetical protein VFW76_05800, partial [Ktedonobacterales bacterium]|nr:hypothetical protein [Ktedonobacterales bacterium]
EMQPTPVASPTRQRVAAWIALALALVHPLVVVLYAIMIVIKGYTNPMTIVVGSLYNVLTYFIWPLPIIAIFLAILALRDARGANRAARAAIILGALSLLAIAGVIIFLALAPGQSASSTAYMTRG